MKEVKKIKVNISRIVNIGGYENITYSLGIDIAGFDSKLATEVQEAIDFGRELCLEDVTKYYQRVKEGLSKGEALQATVDKQYLSLEKKLNSSENERQLRTLEKEIASIKDNEMQKVMQRKFNLKLISLKNG